MCVPECARGRRKVNVLGFLKGDNDEDGGPDAGG